MELQGDSERAFGARHMAHPPQGATLEQYRAASSTAAPTGGAPPPPPPPPPAPPVAPPPPAAASGAAPASGGIGAVFSELNRGEDVTKGLRKVDKSEMTHKNPALRASSVVPATAPSAACKSETASHQRQCLIFA